MKKYLSLLCFTFVSFIFVNAQGNLQFNQVINNQYDAPAPITSYTDYIVGTVVVPAGKVLKVESSSIVSTSGIAYISTGSATLGNHLLWAYSASNNYFINLFPIWLSAGSYDVTFTSRSSSTRVYSVNISAIEFNIVP